MSKISKWHIPSYQTGSESFVTLLGRWAGGASTTSDPDLSAHVYRLTQEESDVQLPHCEAECYYVLSGSRTLESGEGSEAQITPVKEGDLIYVPRQLPHRFTGNSEISFLVFFGPQFTGPTRSGFGCDPRLLAGAIVYRRDGTSLIGQWSHKSTGGALAREVVHDVPPGETVGEWPVEIFSPDGSLIYSGTLTSEKFGDSLKWIWNGTLLPNGPQMKYAGIGQLINPDLLVGTFERA